MDDCIDVVERGPDRIEVRDVRDVARELLRRQRQGRELVPATQVLPHGRADRPLRARDQDAPR